MRRWSKWSIAMAVATAAVLLFSGSPGRAGDDDGIKNKRVVVIGDDEAPRAYAYSFFGGDDEGAFLGVNIKEETEHPEGGARITGIVDDSPAEAAGLEEGDIIVGFDGDVIRGPARLTQKIHEKEPGDTVSVQILRDGRKRTIDVELGKRENRFRFLGVPGGTFDEEQFQEQMEKLREQMPQLREQLEGLKHQRGPSGLRWYFDTRRPVLGVELVETTDELRQFLGGNGETGVLVGRVLKGTPAEAAGVRVGDLIVGVGGDEIESAGDLIDALSDRAGETFRLDVIREHKSMSLDVTLPEVEKIDEERVGPRALVVPPAPPAPRTRPVGPAPPAAPAPPGPPAPAVAAPPAPRADLSV